MRPEEKEMCNALEEDIRGLEDVLEIGKLNYAQLLRDCRVLFIRNEDHEKHGKNKIVPLTVKTEKFNCDRYTRVQYGQHEGDNIRGVGRICWLTDKYELIWEG